MKLIVNIAGEPAEVSFEMEGGRLTAEIDGRKYALEASVPEPNIRLLKWEGKIYEFTVLRESDGRYTVSRGSSQYQFNVADPRSLSAAASEGAETDGVVEIRTQMPGKVVRLLSAVGDEVSSGDGVVVVEAMKMQNEMKSPKDGTVREVRAAEGDTVNAGDVLVVIE